uniref:Thiamine-monophosphate kinase n=1 Tax=Candidatus Methanophagaceae archaeon ANME-1 ERB6 TaxID=2759912 RepID=A0A7G9YZW6_9EURY|nr:thiamine-monophosphate kinase [Methanosarcinales archaeon ANME-1 ERB6]
MKIEELGETGLIERIVKKFRVNVNKQIVMVGAGEDDCAVIDIDKAKGGHKYLVVTTDTVQESTHFPVGISPFQIGWSAAAVNLSDIAAMGAHPFAFTVAMGIPAHTEAAFMDEVVEGIENCTSAYNTAVVGGDITKSKEVILTGTCFGFADKPVRRAGAEIGDLVCVTGSLGNAALGMNLIKIGREIKVPVKVEQIAKKALFQPVPRIREGIALADSGLVTSMIDISDGLALSLAELAKSSGVGFEIYEDKVPVLSEELRSAETFDLSSIGVERRALAFYGGDYELLFTVNANGLERMSEMINMSVIGKVMPHEAGIYFKKGEEKEKIELIGYQHF